MRTRHPLGNDRLLGVWREDYVQELVIGTVEVGQGGIYGDLLE